MAKILLGLFFTLFLVIFIPVYGIGEPARQAAALVRITKDSKEKGAEVFLNICASCHGSSGEGRVGPSIKNTKLDGEVLTKTITFGRPANPVSMPAFGQELGGPLKNRDIKNVVTFLQNWDQSLLIRAQAKHTTATEPLEEKPASSEKKASISADEKPSAEFSQIGQNILQGKELYVSFGCAACHGPEGKGVIGPNIVGKNKDEIISMVRKPRSSAMPAFSSERLSDSDLEKIVIFIGSLNK